MEKFVLFKLIQTRMRSHPVGLDVWFVVGPFVYFHTPCVRTVKALARLRRCADLPEPSLVAYVISTIISWAGLNWIITTPCCRLRTWLVTCWEGIFLIKNIQICRLGVLMIIQDDAAIVKFFKMLTRFVCKRICCITFMSTSEKKFR